MTQQQKKNSVKTHQILITNFRASINSPGCSAATSSCGQRISSGTNRRTYESFIQDFIDFGCYLWTKSHRRSKSLHKLTDDPLIDSRLCCDLRDFSLLSRPRLDFLVFDLAHPEPKHQRGHTSPGERKRKRVMSGGAEENEKMR